MNKIIISIRRKKILQIIVEQIKNAYLTINKIKENFNFQNRNLKQI